MTPFQSGLPSNYEVFVQAHGYLLFEHEGQFADDEAIASLPSGDLGPLMTTKRPQDSVKQMKAAQYCGTK